MQHSVMMVTVWALIICVVAVLVFDTLHARNKARRERTLRQAQEAQTQRLIIEFRDERRAKLQAMRELDEAERQESLARLREIQARAGTNPVREIRDSKGEEFPVIPLIPTWFVVSSHNK